MLLLLRQDERATLFLSEGRIIRCDIEQVTLRGAEKVFYVLGWSQGRFDFATQEIPASDEVAMSVDDLLAEHTRRGAE